MDDAMLPQAVIVTAQVPGTIYARGDMITDPAAIASIYAGGYQGCVVSISPGFIAPHLPTPASK